MVWSSASRSLLPELFPEPNASMLGVTVCIQDTARDETLHSKVSWSSRNTFIVSSSIFDAHANASCCSRTARPRVRRDDGAFTDVMSSRTSCIAAFINRRVVAISVGELDDGYIIVSSLKNEFDHIWPSMLHDTST